jgi:hypothetical protein
MMGYDVCRCSAHKILSVKTTLLPTGERIVLDNGMPQHPYREVNTMIFVRWSLYIRNEVNKIMGLSKIVNRIKAGDVCHSEGQESALKLAKEILR